MCVCTVEVAAIRLPAPPRLRGALTNYISPPVHDLGETGRRTILIIWGCRGGRRSTSAVFADGSVADWGGKQLELITGQQIYPECSTRRTRPLAIAASAAGTPNAGVAKKKTHSWFDLRRTPYRLHWRESGAAARLARPNNVWGRSLRTTYDAR